MKKVFIVNEGNGYNYTRFFERLGWKVRDGRSIPRGFNPNLICLTGGTDITPELYGEERRPETYPSDVERDDAEFDIYADAVKDGIPILGICRGAQLICVLNNGRLVQHVLGHGRPHKVIGDVKPPVFETDEEFEVSSSHHQMMVPEGGDLLAYSKNLSPRYLGDGYVHKMEEEPEAVYWPGTNSLGVQWHPEWMEEDERGFTIVKEWIDSLLMKENNCGGCL
jgi:putative glutamine amidotransferase